MPGDEQKKKSKNMHAWLAITAIIVSVDVSHELQRGEGQIRYQSVSLDLAIVKNCLKRLSEAHTTQTKPGPSHGRPDSTADLRQQLADHEADKDKQDTKCLSNLGDCRELSKEARRWNSRNQGSSQLTVWQWLTRAHRV